MPAPISLTLALTRPSAVQPSPNVLAVAGMFGLGLDTHRDLTIIPPTTLTLAARQIVFITGPSGSGKSSLLRLTADALKSHAAARAIDLAAAIPRTAEHLPLVDTFAHQNLEGALRFLGLAGLNDAFILLRTPSELSDGQRCRLRLAHALAAAGTTPRDRGDPLVVLLADEFGATLDRLTASVIARNLRRLVSGSANLCLVAATTHDDLLESLEPDVLIEKHLGERLDVHTRGETGVKP